ncbi:hypothetical protein D9M72_654740 [compost metagenome]
MAAAARQIMPTAVVPPRSTTSAKFTAMPRYSAAIAGTKVEASWNSGPLITRPSRSLALRPASASARAARSATCSRWNILGAVEYFSGLY